MTYYPKLVLLIFGLITIFGKQLLITNNAVLGVSDSVVTAIKSDSPVLETTVSLKINSSFDHKEVEEPETIPFETEYKDDPEKEYGLEEVIQEGINGIKTYIYKVAFWHNEEISRDLLGTKVEPAVPEIISVGKKVIWREVSTEYGTLKYWRKLHVFATKYDGNCTGCRGLTYSGTLVRKGVCAVDPKVIPLGTNFYVEGYGMCRSEDIGGLIKGNRIDLGYEDVTKGTWRTGYTNIYLLTSAPEN